MAGPPGTGPQAGGAGGAGSGGGIGGLKGAGATTAAGAGAASNSAGSNHDFGYRAAQTESGVNKIPPILPHERVFPIQIGSELFKLSGASISSDGTSKWEQEPVARLSWDGRRPGSTFARIVH